MVKTKYEKFISLGPWVFLSLTVLSAVVCVLALRSNYSHMVNLRNEVFAADKNNGDVNQALINLQNFVTTHMNTDLSSGPNSPYPPIQLEYTYQRLQKASLAKLGYTDYYTQAQNYCESKYPQDFFAVVSCTQSYIEQHPVNIKVKNSIPPAALYEFDFVSPSWSPDLAGWTMVLAILFLILLVISSIARRLHKRKLAHN